MTTNARTDISIDQLAPRSPARKSHRTTRATTTLRKTFHAALRQPPTSVHRQPHRRRRSATSSRWHVNGSSWPSAAAATAAQATASANGGIVLDLSLMKGLEIDPGKKVAWAKAGLTAGEVTNATAAHGLAVGFGDTGSVGLGGLTTGGGVGYLVRKQGLTIDNLLAAETSSPTDESCRSTIGGTPTSSGRSAAATATSASSRDSSQARPAGHGHRRHARPTRDGRAVAGFMAAAEDSPRRYRRSAT